MLTAGTELNPPATIALSPGDDVNVDSSNTDFQYSEAFARNLGLISAAEQQQLSKSRVAIAGMGGVGGVHLMAMTRLGIGRFRIADPDNFELANFNRQYGADTSSIGKEKAATMASVARSVNPELEVDHWNHKVTAENVDDFLDGVDVFVDGIDFFSFEARRMVFNECRKRGIWAVTAGPIGFSTAWVVFDPQGMSFDEYFDIQDGMDKYDMFAAFTCGLTPKGTHWGYLDLSQVDNAAARGPSVGLACNLASGVASAEVCKILLGRQPVRPAPFFCQFDAYRGLLRQGKLRWGNRGPLQRIKRRILRKRIESILG